MRKIEPKMVEWIDAKLKGNGLAQEIIELKDQDRARQLLILAAQACVGIREKGGNNRGPLVELMQETIGGAEREAWCMSAAQTWLAYVETKLGIKSPIFASEHCMTTWTKTPAAQRVLRKPLPGAIIIWNYPPGSNGHTGILVEHNGATIGAVEGNTESGLVAGKIERDGGGVYATRRASRSTPKMRLVGYLKPF
jgi:hypothetical protein